MCCPTLSGGERNFLQGGLEGWNCIIKEIVQLWKSLSKGLGQGRSPVEG